MDESVIAQSMLAFLNGWRGKPSRFTLNVSDKPPSVCLQQLTGTVVENRYVDGSFIGSWPFAVYVIVDGTKGTSVRFNAVKVLDSLASWMKSAALPDIGSDRVALGIEMTGLPVLAARYENGQEDYQAVFSLKYKQRSN